MSSVHQMKLKQYIAQHLFKGQFQGQVG